LRDRWGLVVNALLLETTSQVTIDRVYARRLDRCPGSAPLVGLKAIVAIGMASTRRALSV
jgi:hypothetical protein